MDFDFETYRNTVLSEVLKLITDKAIVVDGDEFVIRTCHSDAGRTPEMVPVDQSATFDTMGRSYYTWRISLIGT